MTAEAPAANVVEALRRVMRDLPGIGRDQTASQSQGGYAYRGIEQITRETQGLFARHGVVFAPSIDGYEIRDLVVNGKPWTDTVLQVRYEVYGPGGVEDRITVGPILAIGRDNSDKGANKALTQALKYALLQTLCISDAKDDADGHTHEADRRQERSSEAIDAALLLEELDAATATDVKERLEAKAGCVLLDALEAESWRTWLRQAVDHHKAKGES